MHHWPNCRKSCCRARGVADRSNFNQHDGNEEAREAAPVPQDEATLAFCFLEHQSAVARDVQATETQPKPVSQTWAAPGAPQPHELFQPSNPSMSPLSRDIRELGHLQRGKDAARAEAECRHASCQGFQAQLLKAHQAALT